ncbi:MAG: VCBS repeat-containing protein [Verrucomicrobiae bacterium]|nr:VCBS repeat-containing protein [Verrucomicrobiae bacterium]MCP5551420.1 VCBS repeat-containing protein [Akkermansiaceae bacterium]
MKRQIPLVFSLALLAGAVLAQQAGKKAGAPKPKWRVQQLHKDNNEGIAVGDIDGDGKIDVVAGEYWYQAPEFKQHKVRRLVPFGADYLQNNSDHLFDVDGDGLLDVVAMGYTEPGIFWFKNPGPGHYDTADGWAGELLADSGGKNNEISFLHDLDGDGTPEFIVNSWKADNPTEAWRLVKDDDGKPKMVSHLIGAGRNGHGMGFGDINGDGLEDIVFMQGWFERPKDGPFSGEWKFHDDFDFPHSSCPMLVVDLDGDGRNDIIHANGHNYGLWWDRQLEPQPDGTTTWRNYLIDDKFSQGHALAWDDVDNDGEPELVTGKRYYAHSGKDPGAEDPITIQYYDWDKSTLTWTKQVVSQGEQGKGPGIGLQIRVADIDGNGFKDIAVPGKSGTHIIWNEGTPSP